MSITLLYGYTTVGLSIHMVKDIDCLHFGQL